VTGDRDAPGKARMLELAMRAPVSHEIPILVLD